MTLVSSSDRSITGSVWKYVPFSPAGTSPIFFSCSAIHAVARVFPGVANSRPPIESSA